MARRFGFTTLGWINDFQGIAYSLPHLGSADRQLLHGGHSEVQGKLATIGPGTGLGGATLEIVAGTPMARACEPGHMGLAMATTLELEIARLLQAQHGEIHAELLVSGPGLQRLYRVLAQIRGVTVDPLTPADISSRALAGRDELCVLTLNTFCALLGSVCGDFVLAGGAYGGLYLAGGIIPRMVPFLRTSSFAPRFREKGAMGDLLADVPLYAITTAQPGLIGAAHAPL